MPLTFQMLKVGQVVELPGRKGRFPDRWEVERIYHGGSDRVFLTSLFNKNERRVLASNQFDRMGYVAVAGDPETAPRADSPTLNAAAAIAAFREAKAAERPTVPIEEWVGDPSEDPDIAELRRKYGE